MSNAASTPAGWYDDGATVGMLRYWDGQEWTQHLAPREDNSRSRTVADASPISIPDDDDPVPEAQRQDVVAALTAMRVKSRVKREIRALSEYLTADERVLRMAVGTRSSQRGILVLTDRRLFFLWQGMVRHSSESIPLDLVTAVTLNQGLITSSIKTQGAQALEVVGQIDKSDAQALAYAFRSFRW